MEAEKQGRLGAINWSVEHVSIITTLAPFFRQAPDVPSSNG